MTSSGPWVSDLGLDAVIRQLPVGVIVVEAGSLRIVEFNDRTREIAERKSGRFVPGNLADGFEIFHLDGRPYAMDEWPVMRSITSGEEVVGEEYLDLLSDGTRLIIRCSSSPIYDDHGQIVAGVVVVQDITEQKRVEEDRAYHAGLLENVEDAVIAIDPGRRTTAWNEGAERMYGWSADETLGRHLPDFLRMDMGDEQLAQVRRELEERGRWRGEATVERKDGSTVWIEAIDVAIRDNDGEITGYLGIHRDISERKRAEAELRSAQERSETILESISDSFGALDADWRYTYINRSALELAGKARGEELLLADVLGRRIWDVFPQLVGTTIYDGYHRAVREQKTVVFESYSPVIDGWVEVHAYPSKDGGLSIYARDITERRRAQEQLAYYARLVENMEDGVIATDARFRVTAWNRGAERLYGWTADEMLGRHVQDVIQTELSDEELDLRFGQVAQQGRARSELVAFRKDGTTIDVELITVAIPGERGEVTGYVAIHRDITERKRAEEALREAKRNSETILESITDSFTALDAEWRYTYLNQRALDRVEQVEGKPVPLSDLVGKVVWDAFPDVVGTTVDRELHRAVREQRTVAFELYSPRTEEWLEVRVYPSKAGGVSVYVQDITARKHAERQLAYHASLLENVDDAVVGTDPEFRLTIWNSGAERLYGWDRDEVLGRDARDVASYEGDRSRLELEAELLETGRTRTEIAAYRKDGSQVEVELISVAVRDSGGEISGYLGIHRDITERKLAERALREAHGKTETVLESITDVFVALDAEWRYTYVNGQGLDHVRKAKGEDLLLKGLLGRSVWEVFPEIVGTTVDHELHRAVREQRPVVFETYSPLIDMWVEVHAYPSKDGGVSFYSRGITERKRAEEQLERRIQQQAAVAELGVRALEDGALQPLMDEAVRLVCRALGVDFAKVDELLPEGEGLLVSAGAGWREGVVGSVMAPGRGSPAGYALLVREPVIVDDMSAETRFEVPAVLREHGVMSYISVVIDPRGIPFGTLAAASTKRRTFSEDDVSFVQSVANVLATAVERAHTDERHETVREAERARLARAMHDEALQGLADAIALVAMADRTTTESRLAGQLLPVLRRVGQQLRSAIYDLRLESEEKTPFVELLEQLVDEHRAMAGDSEIEVHIGDGVPTGSAGTTGVEVLHIVGEALTNARRHADARHINVQVGGEDHHIWVEISDDGRGFDTGKPGSPLHRGLSGMRERAELLNGHLEIASAPGAGTTVRLKARLTRGKRDTI